MAISVEREGLYADLSVCDDVEREILVLIKPAVRASLVLRHLWEEVSALQRLPEAKHRAPSYRARIAQHEKVMRDAEPGIVALRDAPDTPQDVFDAAHAACDRIDGVLAYLESRREDLAETAPEAPWGGRAKGSRPRGTVARSAPSREA